MNKWKHAFLGLMTLTTTAYADLGDDTFGANDVSTFDQSPETPENDKGPFLIRVSYDAVGKAKFDKKPFKGEKFRFSEFNADASMVLYYNPCYKEGVVATVGWTNDKLDWRQNPYFHEKHFNWANVTLGAFTSRAERWDWKAIVKMYFDPHHMNFQEYLAWDFMVWGRYALNCDWGIHGGVIALTGMKIDRFYPIIGFDWRINDAWKLNLVYPTNVSFIYTWNCNWNFAIAGRFWEVRHRAGSHEPVKKALWVYRNAGIEAAANYVWNSWLTVNAHVGYTFGGTLKIANRHYDHKKNLNFKGAPYIGAEVTANF